MGPVYSIRSGRDDPRGCYAGSGESLAAWAGGIYRSCAGAECRLLCRFLGRRVAAFELRALFAGVREAPRHETEVRRQPNLGRPTAGHRRLLHRNIQTYKMRHLHRSFLDLRGQGDPDFTIIREGAALISEVRVTPILRSYVKGLRSSCYQEAQPPRYTISLTQSCHWHLIEDCAGTSEDST